MNKKWLTDIPFAHRGLHGPATGFVENSQSAFLAANDRGHGFELDVLLSRDDRAMVFHDLSLHRLTGQRGDIQDFTAEQLSAFKLRGSDEAIPTLESLLASIDQKYPVLIEIKGDQGRADDISQAVFQDICDYAGPKAIMSFTPDIIRWFQEHAPGVTRGLVATSIKADKDDVGRPEEYFSITRQKSLIDELAVDFIAYDIRALPNEVTEYCRKKKTPVLTWTVRTEKQRRRALLHTDNIIYEIAD